MASHRWRARLLQGYRAAAVAVLAFLIHWQTDWRAARQSPSVTLARVRAFFPEASRVGPRDAERGMQLVFDGKGRPIGAVLTTSPEADDIIGYSGPNNVLVALDPQGAIAGLEWLDSGDTPEHVAMVRRDEGFLPSLHGWRPDRDAPPDVEAVSGATLTSLAVVEAVQRRLAGAAPSLRFPEPLGLEAVQGIFTNAASFTGEQGAFLVRNESGDVIGQLWRTSPQADQVSGYSGPTEALVGLDAAGETVVDVVIGKSYDTPSYVDQVSRDAKFLSQFRGRSVESLASLSFEGEQIDGVSGATQTAWALAEGMKRRLARELGRAETPDRWRLAPRDWVLVGLMLGSLSMAFTPLRGRRWVRHTWQAILIVYVGWMGGYLLSLALLGGWAAHGVAWKAAPGLVLLAGMALLTPLFSKRQVYCHQWCPHGAAQEWAGKLTKRRWTPPARWSRWLEKLPAILLMTAVFTLLLGLAFPLANLEPFDAWVWPAAGWVTVAIAVGGLGASIFIPQAYCRYGCPTGALLSFVRHTGRGDRWGARDWVALGFVAMAGLLAAGERARHPSEPVPQALALHGTTMGTTWTVKVRDLVQDPEALQGKIAKEFDWTDRMTSHWNAHTDVSAFNMAYTTNPVAVPWPVTKLAGLSADISRATEGAYDITVGPLVRLWGFGPAPRRDRPPYDEDIAAKLESTGWRHLEVLDGQLRKSRPGLEIDLSAIAPGWAVDEIARLLEYEGYREFLVESGGELRARGTWRIEIEHPARTVELRDAALGTSGTYRQRWEYEGRTYSHLLDPRTGRPVTHATESVSVRAETCAQADAWAAALNVMGVETGLPLANEMGLAAQFVERTGNGELAVHASDHW